MHIFSGRTWTRTHNQQNLSLLQSGALATAATTLLVKLGSKFQTYTCCDSKLKLRMVGSRRLMQLQAYLWYVVVVLYMDYNISSRKCAEREKKIITSNFLKIYFIQKKLQLRFLFSTYAKKIFRVLFLHKLLEYVLISS